MFGNVYIEFRGSVEYTSRGLNVCLNDDSKIKNILIPPNIFLFLFSTFPKHVLHKNGNQLRFPSLIINEHIRITCL